MRVGISVTTSYLDYAGPDGARSVIEQTQAAADAGLDHLSVGDHHATGPRNTYMQNVPMLARLLAEWPADRPAGALFLLPLWHPVLMAEQIATLAAFTPARFIVQTGLGDGARQFGGMGASLRTRGAVADEWITAVKALLAGETISIERLGIIDACIAPRPVQPVEWWIGAGTVPRPLERAASQGDAWYVGPGPSDQAFIDAIGRYRERAAAHGRPARVIVRRDVHLQDDHETAVRYGRRLIDAGYRGMSLDEVLVGNADAVLEQLQPLIDAGVDDLVIRAMAPTLDEAVESITEMGRVRRSLRGSAI